MATRSLPSPVLVLGLAFAPHALAQEFDNAESVFESLRFVTAQTLLDVDGDGMEDLLFYDSPFWSWAKRKGTTEFDEPRRLNQLGRFFESDMRLSKSDLNGDGLVDLLYKDSEGLQSWVAGPDGFTNFPTTSPDTLLTFSASLRTPLLMDVDGDGDLDAICSESNLFTSPLSIVQLFRNDGAGNFSAPEPLYATDLSSVAVDLGDVDDDGLLDILVNQSKPCFLRNLGTGQFAAPIPIVAGLTGGSSHSMADVNGDGLEDLLVVDGSSQGPLVVYVNQGGGNFSPGLDLGGQVSWFGQLLVEDVTGDGRVDIVNGAADEFGLFENLGGNQWAAFRSIDLGFFARQTSLLADVDGDGATDLIFHGYDETRRFFLGLASPIPNLFGPIEPITGRVPISGDVILGTAELDGVAPREIIATSPSLGLGTALFTPLVAVSQSLGDLQVTEFDQGIIESIERIEGVDLNGDGLDDILIQDEEGTVFSMLNVGGGQMSAPVFVGYFNPSFPWGPPPFEPADMDGDGDLDLLVSVTAYSVDYYENDGLGTFTGPLFVHKAPNPLTSLKAADLDGDGLPEIVAVSRQTTGRTFILPNLGGSFGAPVQVQGIPTQGHDVVVGDFDQDGQQDLVVSSRLNRELYVLTGLGNLDFALASTTLTLENALRVEVHDIGADGDPDVTAKRGVTSGSLYVFANDGAGILTAAERISVDSYDLVDLDLDGDMDLLAGTSAGQVSLFRGTADAPVGASYCGPAVPHTAGQDPGAIAASGSSAIVANSLVLRVDHVSRFSTVLFLTSRTAGTTFPVMGSEGRLCLAGRIGRFLGQGQVVQAGSTGTARLPIDLTSLPTPAGPVMPVAGETWYFQAWFRTTTGSTNFTDGLAISFQ